MKTALNFSTATLDAQLSSTWTAPGGVVVQKLPVSPLLKDGIAQALRGVLALLPQPLTAAVRSWCVALYTPAAIDAYLHDRGDHEIEANILTLNGLSFGTASDLPVGAKAPLFVPTAATSATNSTAAGVGGAWADQLVSTKDPFSGASTAESSHKKRLNSASAPVPHQELTNGALALLEHLRGVYSVTEGLADTTDVHQVCWLCCCLLLLFVLCV